MHGNPAEETDPSLGSFPLPKSLDSFRAFFGTRQPCTRARGYCSCRKYNDCPTLIPSKKTPDYLAFMRPLVSPGLAECLFCNTTFNLRLPIMQSYHKLGLSLTTSIFIINMVITSSHSLSVQIRKKTICYPSEFLKNVAHGYHPIQ